MSAERRNLVYKTEERISTLNEALQEIHRTKQDLRDNSAEVKSQIHAVVSRQLETLRNREVWLLAQVEVLETTKEQVLRAQEDKLHHALGSLTNSLQFSQVDDDGLKITSTLTDSLERLNQLELRPLESSHISFHADVSGLRRVIKDFGRVDSRGAGSTMERAFVHPGETTSTSLPYTFEDYGDAEHHVLYKTLEDVRRERQDDHSIQVTIPRLAKPMAEWLAWTPGTTPTPTSSKGGHFTFPPFNTQPNTHIDSIHQWLADIKLETEVEEDDFEVINASHGGRRSSVSESSSMEVLHASDGASDATPQFPYFSTVQNSPQLDWLMASDPHNVQEEAVAADKMHAYFTEAMQNTEKWLLAEFHTQPPTQPEVDAAQTQCCGGAAGACPAPPAGTVVDMEDLDLLAACVDYPVFTTVKQSNAALWLLKEGEESEKDVDEAEGIQEVCRANEMCSSFSQCVCDEHCSSGSGGNSASTTTTSSPQHTPAQPAAAVPTTALEEELSNCPLFTYFKTLPTLHSSQWLLSECTPVLPAATHTPAPGDAPTATLLPATDMFPVFSSSLPPSTWLLTCSPSATLCPVTHNFCHMEAIQGSEDAQWLLASPTSTTPCPATHGFYHMEAIQQSGDAQWLLASSPSAAPSPVPHGFSGVHHHMEAVRQSGDAQWLKDQQEPTKPCVDLTHAEFSSEPICAEKGRWLLAAYCPPCSLPLPDTPVMSTLQDAKSATPDNNPWLYTPPHTTPTHQPELTHTTLTHQPANTASPTIPQPDMGFNTTSPSTPHSEKSLNTSIWLQKKSLSLEEDDLDVPLMSETVAVSVSSMFAKLGLGHGPWLRAGDNRLSPEEQPEEEDDAHWLLKKEKATGEKLSEKDGSQEKELFPCFHEKHMSSWLSKTSLED